VLFLFASENAFAFSSSCVLEEEPFPKEGFSPCTLEYQRAKRLARLGETADLLGVFALVAPHGPWVLALPWLIVSPPGTGYVAAPWPPDFGLCSYRPKWLMTSVSALLGFNLSMKAISDNRERLPPRSIPHL
jgi:hypothetical protein